MAFNKSFPVTEREILQSNTTRYMVMNFKGEGSFGKVAQCLNLKNDTMVAVKIHKDSRSHSIKEEVEMLKAIRNLDPDKNNIVRFVEHFTFNSLSCLAFEMLDKSLWDLMKERKFKGMSLNQIRPVTQQVLVALKALRRNGIMHTDLKPDNVMLVDHQNQPFRVKLIDFGLALPVTEAKVGMLMQAQAYRAPEVTLGLPLSESLDMWGLGCIMAFMYFGINLFPRDCKYHCMKLMLQLLGQPDDSLLDIGQYSEVYFTKAQNSRWRFKTPNEYKTTTGKKPKTHGWYFDCNQTLDEIIRSYPEKSFFEFKDRMAFSHLIVSCLHPSHDDRITPREALQHEFLTMANLGQHEWSVTYINPALRYMDLTPQTFDSEDNRISEATFSNFFSTDTDGSRGINAGFDEDDNKPANEAGSYREHAVKSEDGQLSAGEIQNMEDDKDPANEAESYQNYANESEDGRLSDGEIQIMESSSRDTDSSSGIDAGLDEDSKGPEDEELSAPFRCGCGHLYTGSEEKEGHPEHFDQSEDGSNYEESNASFSLSPGEIQIMYSSTIDSSSGSDASFDSASVKCGCGNSSTGPEDEEEGHPEHFDQSEDDCSYAETNLSSLSLSAGEIQIEMKCSCGQSYNSDSASCPSSPDNDGVIPNMSHGLVEEDQQASTAASVSSDHDNTSSPMANNGTAAPVESGEPNNTAETAPVTIRRKTIKKRIGRFFRRLRKLFQH